VLVHVYASPTANQSNYTAGYTFTVARSIAAAAAGAPAAIDVHAVTAYTIAQNPGTGVADISTTADTFDNQVAVTGGTSLQEVAVNTVAVGTDESAGASGGGPFTKTTTTNTSYASPQLIGVYPLVAGATVDEPIGRTVATTATDANGGNADTTTVFDVSSNNVVNSDGSYSLAEQLSNGESQTDVESSNGSGTIGATGPAYVLADTIGVPVASGTGYAIPVTTDQQFATLGATPAPTATTMPYSAADWYPGGALPASPLQTDTVTVKGAATALPAGCAGAVSEPNVFEIDTTSTTLNVVQPSYAMTTQQSFNSNGNPVCILRTTTTKNYALTTGLLAQTTTETFAQILTSLTIPSTTSAKLRQN
jgi:hypothetical protein